MQTQQQFMDNPQGMQTQQQFMNNPQGMQTQQQYMNNPQGMQTQQQFVINPQGTQVQQPFGSDQQGMQVQQPFGSDQQQLGNSQQFRNDGVLSHNSMFQQNSSVLGGQQSNHFLGNLGLQSANQNFASAQHEAELRQNAINTGFVAQANAATSDGNAGNNNTNIAGGHNAPAGHGMLQQLNNRGHALQSISLADANSAQPAAQNQEPNRLSSSNQQFNGTQQNAPPGGNNMMTTGGGFGSDLMNAVAGNAGMSLPGNNTLNLEGSNNNEPSLQAQMLQQRLQAALQEHQGQQHQQNTSQPNGMHQQASSGSQNTNQQPGANNGGANVFNSMLGPNNNIGNVQQQQQQQPGVGQQQFGSVSGNTSQANGADNQVGNVNPGIGQPLGGIAGLLPPGGVAAAPTISDPQQQAKLQELQQLQQQAKLQELLNQTGPQQVQQQALEAPSVDESGMYGQSAPSVDESGMYGQRGKDGPGGATGGSATGNGCVVPTIRLRSRVRIKFGAKWVSKRVLAAINYAAWIAPIAWSEP
jgi:hypothetical protein